MIKVIFEHKLEVPTIMVEFQVDDFEEEFDGEKALAVLLLEDVVFLNNHWWLSASRSTKFYKEPPENPWPEDACNTFSISVNCNDIFAWACADAEECYFDELQDLFNHWKKDKTWGSAVWCIKKRNQLPQKPVYDSIMKTGIWDLDNIVTNQEET